MQQACTFGALAFVVACGCPPLAEVTVRGAEPAHRGPVERAIRDFAASASVEVCVDAIHLRPVGQGDGRYNKITRDVAVDSAPTVDPYRVTLHELCHAADVQHDLGEAHEDLLLGSEGGTRRDRQEAWARACAHDPLDLWLATDLECPQVDEGSTARWSAVRADLLGVAPDEYLPSPGGFEEIGAYDLGAEGATHEVRGCASAEQPTSVLVYGVTDGTGWTLRLDPYTGQEVGSTVGADTRPDTPFASVPEAWRSLAGVEVDGRGVNLAVWSTPRVEVRRLLATYEEGWAVVDACPAPDECLFEREGEVWAAHTEGHVLRWGRMRW